MLIRASIVAIAFGLIAALGQAQEKTESAQRQAETQQEPAQALPIPLPVKIVEDEAASDARRSSEEETRQREISDLIAQEGMNAATQAMNGATQRMAEYAFWSTVFVAVGTVLLIVTLWLTLQANKAAIKSVNVAEKMGRLQTQAYLSFGGTELFYLVEDGDPVRLQVRPKFKNTGQSPGKIVYGFCQIQFPADINAAIHCSVERADKYKINMSIGANEQRWIASPLIPIEIIKRAGDEGRRLVVIGCVEFTDIFDDTPRVEDFCCSILFHSDPTKMVNGVGATHDWNAHQGYSVKIS